MLLLANFSVVFVSPMYEANFKTVYCRMQVAVTSFFYTACAVRVMSISYYSLLQYLSTLQWHRNVDMYIVILSLLQSQSIGCFC